MPAMSRSSEPSTRSTGSSLMSCFSCIALKFPPHLNHVRMNVWPQRQHAVRAFDVRLDVEKVGRALCDLFENGRADHASVVTGALQRLIRADGDEQLRLISGEETNERGKVL